MLDFIVAASYCLIAVSMLVVLAGFIRRSRSDSELGVPAFALAFFATPLAMGLHAYSLFGRLISDDGLQLGFAHAASLIAFVTLLLYWIFAAADQKLRIMLLLALPFAIVGPLLPALMSNAGPLNYGPAGSTIAFKSHILVSIVAYSLAAVAVLHSLCMLVIDRMLHRGELPNWLQVLPSLMELERVLGRLLLVVFILLTATVVSGLFFSEHLFGRPFRFGHKTVFGIAAWLTFGVLLVGRWRAGWRATIAAKWTIAGFVLLLLSYFGSKFVLEIILRRV
jgi:ABC-type uncharacterized transport system permease subunit